MKNLLIIGVVIVLAGAGAWYAFGGGNGGGQKAFGKGVEATVVSIGDIQKAPDKYLNQTVTVEGEMTKECPGSGCWWYVKDASGEIRADSANNGFALPLHQEGKRIRTTGKIIKSEGGDLEIESTGAAFR